MNEKDYDEILEDVRDRFYELNKRERRKYIDVLLKKKTEGDEEKLKQLFEIGKKKGDIPKKLEYSYENLIDALLNASNILGEDILDAWSWLNAKIFCLL